MAYQSLFLVMKITRRRLCAVGLPVAVGGGGCLGGSSNTDGGSSGDADSNDGGDTNGSDETADANDGAGEGDGGGTESDAETEPANEEPTDEGGDESVEPRGDWNDDWAWDGALPVESAVQHHDPSCSCCSNYAAYLEDHGLDVRLEETDDIRGVKEAFDVPRDARSCHTVEIDGYLVEGHVPLEAVATLLEEGPDVDGIAAPGMPRHSPGMGGRSDEPLTIYAFESSGEVTEYEAV